MTTPREQQLENAIRDHRRDACDVAEGSGTAVRSWDAGLWSVLSAPPPEERTCETCCASEVRRSRAKPRELPGLVKEIRIAADQDEQWNGAYLTPKTARTLAKVLIQAAVDAERREKGGGR